MGYISNPLQLKFKTNNGFYVFDGKTGRLYKVTAATFAIFDEFDHLSRDDLLVKYGQLFSQEEVDKAYTILQELSHSGLMLCGSLEQRLAPPQMGQIWETLNHQLKKVTLELTQACNLRCRYCVYSGGYSHYRTHGKMHMSEDLAKAAIDFYADRSAALPAVTFYGGEPLLNLRLLRICVEYARAHPRLGPETMSSFTTNGILLTKPVIDYLVGEGIGLTISLDGPAEHHDRHRVFSNGKGSFEIVFRNIQTLRECGPDDYYLGRVLFACMITPTTDLFDLYEFFAQHQDLFPVGRIRLSFVNKGHETFFRQFPWNRQKLKRDLGTLRRMYEDTLLKRADYPLNFTRALFEEELVRVAKRMQLNRVSNRMDINPSCLPGTERLYVTTDGTLHMCERLGDVCFSLGSIKNGFDRSRIETLVEQNYYLNNAEPCLNCWIVSLCGACYQRQAASQTDSIHISPFIHPSTTSYCQNLKNRTESNLRLYCEMLEQDEHVFEHFSDYYTR